MLPRYDLYDDMFPTTKSSRAAKPTGKWKSIVGSALLSGLIAFIKIAPAIFAGALAVSSIVTTLGLSLVVGAFIGDVVSDVIPSRLHSPRSSIDEVLGKFFSNRKIWQDMRNDFANAFKPYNFALEQDEKRQEWLQPVNGIKNFYNGLKQVAAIPFIVLADLINNVIHSRSVGEKFVNLFLGLTIVPLAHLATGALTMFRGLTQVATTPLVYLDKLLRAGLTYWRYRPKSQPANNFKNQFESKPEGTIERRKSIANLLDEVNEQCFQNGGASRISENLSYYAELVHTKFSAARKSGQVTNISNIEEEERYGALNEDTPLVAEKIRLAKDYFRLFSDNPTFRNPPESSSQNEFPGQGFTFDGSPS